MPSKTTTEPETKSTTRRRKISLAVLTGIVAGAIRAVVEWAIEYLLAQL